MLIFMNMRDIFLQLTATDLTRLKIDHGPTTSKKQELNKNKLTATNYGLLWTCRIF
jgi:hypothetical protein